KGRSARRWRRCAAWAGRRWQVRVCSGDCWFHRLSGDCRAPLFEEVFMSLKFASVRAPFVRRFARAAGFALRLPLLASLLALGIAAGSVLAPAGQAHAQAAQQAPEAVTATVRKALEPVVRGRKVDEVRRTPVPGMYEARI